MLGGTFGFYPFFMWQRKKYNPNPVHFSEECGWEPGFIMSFSVSICTILL